jgi:hypothetical protein
MLDTIDVVFCYTTDYLNPKLGYFNVSADASKFWMPISYE